MTINTDAKYNGLGRFGYSGAQEDRELKFYKANGATSDNVRDAEVQFLTLRGFTEGSVDDRWNAYLKSLGYTGANDDMLPRWWGEMPGSSAYLDFLKSSPFTSVSGLDPRITFSRASNATVIGPDGTLQYAPHNLLTYSEQFDNAAWSKTSCNITANAVTAPNGSVTADRLVPNVGLNSPSITSIFTASAGVSYVLSVHVKPDSTNKFLMLQLDGDLWNSVSSAERPRVWFDPTTGAITATQRVTGSGVEVVADGSYRVYLSVFCSTSGATAARIAMQGSSGSVGGYTGDGTSGIFLWGAQLNVGALQPYYQTTTAPYYGPRFDYDPVALAPKGLLIEEQRTNSIRNNTMQGAVAGTPGTDPTNWLSTPPAGALTSKQIVGVGIEDGITYIDIRYTTNAATTFNVFIFEGPTNIVAANGQTWTSSFFAKLVGGSLSNASALHRIMFRTATGTLVTINDVGFVPTSNSLNSQRTVNTFTAANATIERLTNQVVLVASGAIDITLRIGMPQLEQGAFATSVIPTTTAAATRAADVAVMTGANFSNWYNQSEGTVFVEAVSLRPNSDTTRIVAISDGTANNSIRVSAATTNLAVVTAGNVEAGFNLTMTANAVNKFGLAYKSNDANGATNGTTGTTDTSVVLPVVSQLEFGRLAAGSSGNILVGNIRRVAYFPRRLSNAELQAITS